MQDGETTDTMNSYNMYELLKCNEVCHYQVMVVFCITTVIYIIVNGHLDLTCALLKGITKYLIIRMRGVPSLDSTGMNALENLYDYCNANGVSLIFSHVNEQPMKTLRRAGFVDLVGEEHR